MIEGLKPYAEYKESGHSWLGAVPNHWSVLPNRALFDEVKDRNHPKEEMLSVTITRGIVRQKALLDGSSKKDSSNLNKGAYKLVQPHDIAYNKMRAWQGALGASTLRGIISPAYVVMRPRQEANPWFYHNLYRTPSFAKEAERWSYGITSDMWSLRPEHFKVIGSVLPPPDEQASIVRFLDHANLKIDGFIRAKRKLIALLNEQKQAIIHRVVTYGLNPDAPLKPSGIPWIGDIPKHWVTPMNSRIFREHIRPHNGQQESPLSLSQRAGLIKTEHMQERSLKTSTYDNWKVTIPGDLVANRFKAHLGVFFAATLRGIVSFHYAVFEPQRRMNTKYFELLYHTAPYRTIYAGRSNGMTVGLQNLSNQNFYSVRAIVPPIKEQDAIVAECEAATRNQNAAIARTEREIALIQEYRTRLTADVVTGKLDVREAAAKLPDLANEAHAEPDSDELFEEPELEESKNE